LDGTSAPQPVMSTSEWTWRSDRVIGSQMEYGRQVMDELLQQLAHRHWSRRDRFAVHLAMEEAIVNAIRHGNGYDPDKHVHISCCLADGTVRIEIADEGEGFEEHAVPDPTTPQCLDLPGGRGLALMKAFMSEVEFSQHGRRVTLVKHRSAPHAAGDDQAP